MEERDYYLSFVLASGIGPKTFSSLIAYFKTAKIAWNSNSTELKAAGIGHKTIKSFIDFRENFSIDDYRLLMQKKEAKFIALCDKEYPKLLAKIDSPPLVLFYKGNLKDVNFEKTIGIVGTRKITNYGKEITQLFSQELAQSGLTIVSGLAMGVDGVAAWSAINSGGKTIAVLGNGVDLTFPTVNSPLYDKILQGNGVIISQFPLGMSPTAGSFPARNRIVAGLSQGVLVTEGAQDSGSLITANYALEFNRKVFAIPGPITSSLSAAPLRLIEKGARLVVEPNDILRELKVQRSKSKAMGASQKFVGLSSDEKKIIGLLENESLNFDEIVRKLGIDSSKVGTVLSMMEMKGVIKSSEGNFSISS